MALRFRSIGDVSIKFGGDALPQAFRCFVIIINIRMSAHNGFHYVLDITGKCDSKLKY